MANRETPVSLGAPCPYRPLCAGPIGDLFLGALQIIQVLFPFRARIIHESAAPTVDMTVLPGVLGYRPLRRTVQVRLRPNTLRLPGGTPIFAISRHRFMNNPG
ncbi:MAG: hypothetical protein WBF55_15815 [Syntrophobacteria bacterium]|nr:hypothetical protein [Deltaproteobacteria bacterium]